MIKGRFLAVGILGLALVNIGSAQGAAAPQADSEHVSQAQLKQLAREAHTPEQYKVLAHYYDVKQKSYLKQAAEEKQEWVRRSQITVSLYAKYPKPADSARNLYEYYAAKAAEVGALSAKYSALADPAGAAAQQHM
jgi:hypothetical protein